MKKVIYLFSIVLLYHKASTQPFPETPAKVNFANVSIILNSDSRQKINNEIKNILTPNNAFLEKKFERIQLYFPIIQKILETENVPDDFKYLALLESGLNSEAVSATKAVGFWQFKDFTASEMGLVMNKQQDDRKNIYLATHAAAKYLKKNNLLFKNWVSTALSYTVGAGGADALVPVDWAYSSEIKLDATPHPYLLKAIAYKIAVENQLVSLPTSNYVFVEYPVKGKTLNEIATSVNKTTDEILENNTWILANAVPGDKDYTILLKTERSASSHLISQAEKLINTENPAVGYPKLKRITTVVTSTNEPVFYEINGKKGILAQSGDEVAQLSNKAKVKISKFLKLNDMTDRDLLKDGLVYYLQKKNKRAAIPYHTVTSSQDLWDVSHMYGVRMKKLKKYNRLSDEEEVAPSRILWLQRKRPRKIPVQYNKDLIAPPEKFKPEEVDKKPEIAIFEDSRKTTSHRVLENETLASIASKYGTTVEELRKINQIGANDKIRINQILEIPRTNNEPEDNWVESNEAVVMPPKKTTPSESVNKPATPLVTSHYVQPGETLFSLAHKYGLTVDELRALNNMTPTTILQAGQTLRLSGSAIVDPTTNIIHEVIAGETLFSISKKYNLSVEDIKTRNNLSDNTIKVGQRLLLAGRSSTTESLQYHIVKKGETLFSISKRYETTVENLMIWNALNNNNIKIGEKLIVNK